MQQTASRHQNQWLFPLILGDIIVFLLFAYIGKAAHAHSIDPLGLIITAAPFLAAWLIIGTLFGMYKPQAYAAGVRTAAKKTAIAWLVACLVGHAIRSLSLGKGIEPVFLMITFISVMLFLQIWRVSFAFFLSKKR